MKSRILRKCAEEVVMVLFIPCIEIIIKPFIIPIAVFQVSVFVKNIQEKSTAVVYY